MHTPSSPSADANAAFDRYREEVYTWAYRILGRHHDALDVAQDVFLRWVRNRPQGGADSPRGWLRRVTMNRAVDLIRSRKSAPGALSSATELSARAQGDALETMELRATIAAALDRLSEMQRSVLIAKVYDGLTFAEIAVDHQLAVPTVKTHYLRAVSAMRDRLRAESQP